MNIKNTEAATATATATEFEFGGSEWPVNENTNHGRGWLVFDPDDREAVWVLTFGEALEEQEEWQDSVIEPAPEAQ